jgi:hypothetical protein
MKMFILSLNRNKLTAGKFTTASSPLIFDYVYFITLSLGLNQGEAPIDNFCHYGVDKGN